MGSKGSIQQYPTRSFPLLVAGITILEYFGLKGEDKWAYVGYLALFWAAFTGLTLLALMFVRHHKR